VEPLVGRLGSAELIAKPTLKVGFVFCFEADMEIEGRNFGDVFAIIAHAICPWALCRSILGNWAPTKLSSPSMGEAR